MAPRLRGQDKGARRITVMVVDDSFFMRTLISDLLCSDAAITVAATAKCGYEAIHKIPKVWPDCVVLDLVMPGLDGVATLRTISANWPMPVVVVSAHCKEGGLMADRCAAAGAVAMVPKPSGEISLDVDTIRCRLLKEVKAAVRSRRFASRHEHAPGLDRPSSDPRGIVVIGASTGGQSTIEPILHALPPRLPVPLVVVQHAPTGLVTQSFAERLNRTCSLPVKVADDGETPHAGVVYLAPGGSYLDFHGHVPGGMESDRQGHRGSTDRPVCFRVRHASGVTLTPSIDHAMQSAALAYGPGTLAIIMTGMGADGLEGMRAVKKARGRTIAQDASALMVEMPQTVIRAGLADAVLPPDKIACSIVEITS